MKEDIKKGIVSSKDRYKDIDKIPDKDRASMIGGAATVGGVGALTGWAAAGKRGGKFGLGAGAILGALNAGMRNRAEKKRRRSVVDAYSMGRIHGAISSQEKTASDYMRQKQSKSTRFMKSTTRRKYVNKGFGGSTRRKKI